jgi:nucleotide-binding universal stress UspA family protein
MYSVLIPVDRKRERASHQAQYVERLADVADELEATVLHVAPPGRGRGDGDAGFDAVDAAVEAAELLEAAGLTVHRSVSRGPVSETVVRTADEQDADEIVMGGRKRSGMAQVLLGSTVHDVLLSTDRAITVTGEASALGDGPRRLLVPVDRATDRARQQVTYVATLPNATEVVEATVLYVFPHLDYTGAPDHEFEEIDAAVESADFLEEAGVSVDRVAVGGEVARTILDTAEDIDADGIVMGGRKRSGVQKVLLGSTAMDVMLSAERPVTLTG